MRKEVILALDRFGKVVGNEFVINMMVSYLGEENLEQRSGIIEWILKFPEDYRNADVNSFI